MDNFVGEIRLFPYKKDMQDWLPCNGQIVQMSQYMALYSLISTQFGGDGKKTFGIPNLNGRTIIGTNANNPALTPYKVGDSGGLESVVLLSEQMPVHLHQFNCNGSYTTSNPTGIFLANSHDISNYGLDPNSGFDPNSGIDPGDNGLQANKGNVLLYKEYQQGINLVSLNPASINSTGGNVGHENRMKFQALVYCIATGGLYPPRP
jgi:microcystin-dependent protein